MDVAKFLLYTGALALGGSAVVIVAYYIVRNDILEFLKTRRTNIGAPSDVLLQLRLQAHERLIIYVDRINPANLLLRLHQQGIEVNAFQSVIVNEIRTEFQHNITQQLYLDAVTWDVVRKLKDDSIAMINNAAQNLSPTAPSVELSKMLLQHMSTIEEDPYELTIKLIKQNLSKLF